MPDNVEIERKFLVDDLPFDLADCRRMELRQGYLAIDDGRKLSVRIRQEDEVYRLTIKAGIGMARTEVELPLDKSQFDSLWPEARPASLEKVRYLKQIDDVLYEIDIYDGSLAPLIIAEVEFGSVEDAEAFQPPPWLSRDVTDDARYLNQNLARAGKPPEAI